MSFVLQYLQKKISDNMEDPKERDRRWAERLTLTKQKADAMKANMAVPTKVDGFWRDERRQAKYETNLDPTISQMPGRASPKF